MTGLLIKCISLVVFCNWVTDIKFAYPNTPGGCLECEASMCVWLAFSCREESVTTYIESVQKSKKYQTLNANIFLQKKKNSYRLAFFNPLVFLMLCQLVMTNPV